ncbi:MAG: pimeloyl-ACP methyl ester esterase BioH [Betaproteobacteria bacterium]|nr:pimeloyl-ACP methyl ester esterase BioH [Betaproteobacteria bacterium]
MNLYVETLGQGPDLAMLHGWAFHGGVWSGLKARLARRFRLHLVDLPGHGQSPAREGMAFEDWVGAVAGVLPERVSVCGWSLGGQIALELAAREPQRFEKVVLVSATPRFVNGNGWRDGIEASVLTRFARDLEVDYVPTLQRFLALQVRGAARGTETLRSLRQTLFGPGRPAPAALESGLHMLLDNDLRSRVGRIAQPVLTIHGGRDALCPPGAGEWLAAHLPDARLALMGPCGHAPFISCPEEFAQHLERFLDGH